MKPTIAYRIGRAIPIGLIVVAHVIVLGGIIAGVWLWTK